MAALNFTAFTSTHKDILEACNLATDTLKLMLTNTAPIAANAVKADITEIAAGNGYTAGGYTLSGLTGAYASGLYVRKAGNIAITASGGDIGPFRYAVIYDDTVASPVKPLLAWADFGAATTVTNGGAAANIDLSTTGFLKS